MPIKEVNNILNHDNTISKEIDTINMTINKSKVNIITAKKVYFRTQDSIYEYTPYNYTDSTQTQEKFNFSGIGLNNKCSRKSF